MQIKEIQPINFIFLRVETTISELGEFVPRSQELYPEAVRLGLKITGPIHWHYSGMDGDMSKPFILEIALPVGEIPKDYDGDYHFKRTEQFRCIQGFHEGDWEDFPKSYHQVFAFIAEQKLVPTGINREVYVNVDFVNVAANIAEIQVGIK